MTAPLAFTSLPLNPAPPTPAQEPHQTEKVPKTKSRNSSPEASRTVKSSVPDLAALISKPALRALEGGTPIRPNESFYLVPPSGGTISYASMVQGPNTQPHHLNPIDEGSGSLKGSHDEFVDAQESVGPPSPTSARTPRSRSSTTQPAVAPQRSIPAGRGTGLKTPEELALENETLKSLVDRQARRIMMWETNSQNNYKLAQSFRARPPTTTTSPRGASETSALPSPPIPGFPGSSAPLPQSPGAAPDATAARVAALEAQIKAQSRSLEEMGSRNEKLARQGEKDRQVIGRYREQWEKLKAGARRKEVERREKRERGREGESVDGVGEVGEVETGGEGVMGGEGEEADFGRA
jgi:hypothetical protein